MKNKISNPHRIEYLLQNHYIRHMLGDRSNPNCSECIVAVSSQLRALRDNNETYITMLNNLLVVNHTGIQL